jgi:iron complex transport system substrate-binding protein
LAGKLTLVDASDRTVTVNKPVERIITGDISSAEAISLLGAWDRVVGRDGTTTDELFFPGIRDLPDVRPAPSVDPTVIDYEKVFELDPDIFLMIDFIADWTYAIDTLEPDIAFVRLQFADPTTLVENTRKLRYILNTEEDGEAYIAWYEGVVNDITEKTAGLSEGDKPRLFLWPLLFDYSEGYRAIAGDWTALQHQIEIVGAKNIAEDLTGWYPEVSEEWLMEQSEDPGIDVITCMVSPLIVPGIFGYDIDDTTVARATRDWVMDTDENPVLAESDAVQNGKVYLFPNEQMGGPRLVVLMAYWAKWFHPELFSDLNPKAIHQEYLTDFMGIDYDLDEHGVFVYPEP